MTDYTMWFVGAMILFLMVASASSIEARKFNKKSTTFFAIALVMGFLALYSRISFNNWYEDECSKLGGVMVNYTCYEEELPPVLIKR